MRILLSALTLIGLFGCHSSQESTSVNSASPASQNQSNGTAQEKANQSTNSPSISVPKGAKISEATNLDGVYIVHTQRMQQYFERATGQSTNLLEILSDRPLWFTVTENNAEPESILSFIGLGEEKTLTHQYLVETTKPIDLPTHPSFPIPVDNTFDLPVRVMHIQSDKVTLDEALSMADGSLISELGRYSLKRNFQFTIPPPDSEVIKGLYVSPTGSDCLGHTRAILFSVVPRSDPFNESLRLIDIGWFFSGFDKNQKIVATAKQSIMTIGVQLEAAPHIGSRNLKALQSMGGKWAGETLDLSGTKIRDQEVFHIVRFVTNYGVYILDLSETDVTDEGLKQLMGLNKLKKLRLSNTKVSDEVVAELEKSLPDCEIVL